MSENGRFSLIPVERKMPLRPLTRESTCMLGAEKLKDNRRSETGIHIGSRSIVFYLRFVRAQVACSYIVSTRTVVAWD